MARKLEKAEFRKRWSELRDLWNEFDPIGVMDDPDWPRDEYERYCGPSMRLLMQNAENEELEAYVRSALDYMGIGANDDEIQSFVKKMKAWFQEKKSETCV